MENKILTLKEAQKMIDENHGNLDLSFSDFTEIPEGLTINGFLDLRYSKISKLPERLKVGDSLFLAGSKVTNLPESLSIGDGLYLGDSLITKLPEGLNVGGDLVLRNSMITELPEGLNVGGNLILSNSKIKELPKGLIVGGTLDLSYSEVTELPEDLIIDGLILCGSRVTNLPNGLTIAGYVYLNYSLITEIPEGLTIGRDLCFNLSNVTRLPESLTIGGRIYPNDKVELYSCQIKRLKNGDYKENSYLFADNMLAQVKKKRTLGKYTVYIGKYKGHNVISDGTYYVHCKKLRDGISDLHYKAAADRGAEQYKGLTLDSEVSVPEAATMYRVITGACRQGTELFIKNLGDSLKEKYSIREIIELTEGQYNSEKFSEFFCA